MVAWVEDVSGKSMDDVLRKNFIRGAKELDLVYSGLQDTMEVAAAQVIATAKQVRNWCIVFQSFSLLLPV